MSQVGDAALAGARTRPDVRGASPDPIEDPTPATMARRDPSGLAGYLAVAASPRYRASERARVRDSSRYGMILIVAAALLDCLWLAPLHPGALALIVMVNVALALYAAATYVALATRARRRPEPFVFVALVACDVATVALGVYRPELGVVAAAYLLLLPTIVSLAIPWSTKTHVLWLAVHGAGVVGYTAVAPEGALGGTRGDILALLVVAITMSQFGHVAGLRARVVSFIQIERIRALNRQARRDQVRMDRLNRILEQTARTDELTGLRNRLSLKLDLGIVRARIARHHERYGVLMLDLDRFKAINDRFGHVEGDGVLRDIAVACVKALRPDDASYRYGGEEFVVLIRVTRPQQALVAAERIRRAVEELCLPHPGNPPYDRVTVSVGVAVIGREDLEADDDAWFARADAALYRAKDGGRNRCETEFPDADAA